MILQIPDELCQRFIDGRSMTPNGIQAMIVKHLQNLADQGVQEGSMTLKRDQVGFLRDVLGSFDTPEDLVNKLRRNCSLRVQGKEYLLTSDQMARLKQEAFFHRNNGEPRSEADCKTPELAEKIISRYVIRQIDYFMKQMCSQI